MELENKFWEVTLEEDPTDPDGVILPIPEELLECCGWKEGDEISMEVKDGQIYFNLIPSQDKNVQEPNDKPA